MRIDVDIETHDRELGDRIVGGNVYAENLRLELPGGATLRFDGATFGKAIGVPEVLQFIVDTAVGVEVNLLAAWLYDKVRDEPVEQITINRRVVTRITRDEITQILEEEIKRGT